MRPAVLELADIAPDPSVRQHILRTARSVPGVLGLDKCFVRKMGFSFYVDLHVVVKGNLSVREGHKIAHQVKSTVLKAMPQISEVLVYIEPEEELLNQTGASVIGRIHNSAENARPAAKKDDHLRSG
jgi:divalent metal cation (Fe/Co/Zn/Cd) transporter